MQFFRWSVVASACLFGCQHLRIGTPVVEPPTHHTALVDQNGDGKINVCLWGDSTLDVDDYWQSMHAEQPDSIAWCASVGKMTQDFLDHAGTLLSIAETVSSEPIFQGPLFPWICREVQGPQLPVGAGCDYVVTMTGYNDFHLQPAAPMDGRCYARDPRENGQSCACAIPDYSAATLGYHSYARCYRGAHQGERCATNLDCATCIGGAHDGQACRPRCTGDGAPCARWSGGLCDGAECVPGTMCGDATCPGCGRGYCSVDYDCPGGFCGPLQLATCVNGQVPGAPCANVFDCGTPPPESRPTDAARPPAEAVACTYTHQPWWSCDPDESPVSQLYCIAAACVDAEHCSHGVCIQRHPTDLEALQQRALIDRVVAFGAKPILILPPDPNPAGGVGCWLEITPQIAWLREFLRALAAERHYNYIDLDAAFRASGPYVDPRAPKRTVIPSPASNYSDAVHFRLGSDGLGARLAGELVGACLNGNPEGSPFVHCDDLK
jgi:hypothetical protein